jgi:hypothetical protein
MKKLASLICITAAAALPMMASAQDKGATLARVEVRRHIPLLAACPHALQELPATLTQSWRQIEEPADVLVDFKLEGDKVGDVKVSGGMGDYDGLVRHAVKTMRCVRPGAGAYAVRFHIKFRYDEEAAAAGSMAMQLVDEPEALAAR